MSEPWKFDSEMDMSLVPKAPGCLKAAATPWAKPHEGVAPGGVSEHGAFKEDDPVTWETPVSPERVGQRRGTTEAEAEGARGVGGSNLSWEVGERVTPDPAEQRGPASR
jgi:hypothetical protein